MVDGINGVSGIQGTSGVVRVKGNQPSGKTKNIPMTEASKLSPEQKEAIGNLKNLVKDGHVKYIDSNILEDVFNFILDKKSGDFIRITDFADPKDYKGGLTFGKAKSILKLNLPPGSLKNNMTTRGGGDFDKYLVPKNGEGIYYLDIFLDDLREATGLSNEEIKAICEEK